MKDEGRSRRDATAPSFHPASFSLPPYPYSLRLRIHDPHLADAEAAFEDGAGADGHGGGGDVADEVGLGADEDGAAADDVPLDLAADDQAAAVDGVGDDVPLALDGDDADRLDDASGLVAGEDDVLEVQPLVAVLAGDGHRLAPDLLRLLAMEADDGDAVLDLRAVCALLGLHAEAGPPERDSRADRNDTGCSAVQTPSGEHS